MDLILVRHGESTFNRDGTGDAIETPLTALGREQARCAGRWLAQKYQFTAFYSSPLARARDSAEIIRAELSHPLAITFLDDLREAEIPLSHYLPIAGDTPQLAGAQPLALNSLTPEYTTFCVQVERAIQRVLSDNSAGTVLVVAHGGTIGTTIRNLLGVHLLSIWTLNAAIHHIGWLGGRWEIRYLNRVEHLRHINAKQIEAV